MSFNLSKKKVLLVDDSAIMRMVLVMHLRRLFGVTVVEAVNGLDAIKKYSAEPFDLVLTDMNMPELDGAGLVRYLRAEVRSGVPIAIITTKGEAHDRELGMSLGANRYLTKPVNVKELFRTVLDLLAPSGPLRFGPPPPSS